MLRAKIQFSLLLLAPYLLKYDMHNCSLFSWINVSCKICIFEVGGMAFFAFIQAPHELLKQNNTTRRKMAKFFVNIVSQSYKSSNTGVALSRWGGFSNVNKKGSSRVSEMSSLTHFSWKRLICVFIIVFKVQHIAMSSRLIFLHDFLVWEMFIQRGSLSARFGQPIWL